MVRRVDEPPPDPYKKYRVEKTEPHKHFQEPFEEASERKTSEQFRKALGNLFYRFISLFEERASRKLTFRDLFEALNRFKEAIEKMKEKDQSEDTPFLHELALSFHALKEESLSIPTRSELFPKMEEVFKAIYGYPENDPYSFGYYLAHYAGEQWFPLPYIQLVQKLHRDHQKHFEASVLANWTWLIDRAISHD